MKRLIKFTLIISLLSVVLATHTYAADDEWLANEVLTQLSDIRRNMTGLKNEIQNLRKEVDALKTKTTKKRKSLNISSLLKDKGGKLGDKNARIAVIEFTDYQCPYCARHVRKTLGNLKQTYVDTGKIQYMVRDFPLGFHKHAKNASIAANCAAEQGEYWKMHEQLFRYQRSLNDARFTELANKLGLDTKSFALCMKDPKQGEKVEQDIALGEQFGVRGTPAFFIGRLEGDKLTDIKALSGAQPFSSFKRVIDSMIN